MRLKPWLLISLLVFQLPNFAKEPISLKDPFVGCGGGMANISHLSPITYSNLSFKSGVNNIKIYPTRDVVYSSVGKVGINTNANNNMMMSFGYDFIIGQNHHFGIPNFENGIFKLGYSFWNEDDFFLKPDNVNNVIYTNISNMAAVNLGFLYKINKARIENRFIIPVVGLYYGSKYDQNLPGILDGSSFLDAFKFGSFNINTQFHNDLSYEVQIRYKKNKKQTLKITYGIDYAKLKLHNNTKHIANHEIKISTLISQKLFLYE